jgi:hypothetical protein
MNAVEIEAAVSELANSGPDSAESPVFFLEDLAAPNPTNRQAEKVVPTARISGLVLQRNNINLVVARASNP